MERQLQLAALDDDVGEVEQVHFERIQHALACDDDLLRLFFYGQGANQRRDFLSSLPFRELTETFLPGPDTRLNHLEQ